jgi:hypothetical protein
MNKQAIIDPCPSWLGTYLQLIPTHTSCYSLFEVKLSHLMSCLSAGPSHQTAILYFIIAWQ